MSDLRNRVEQAKREVEPDGIESATVPSGRMTATLVSDVPDVAESPNVADMGRKAVAAWSAVMADVQWVGKVNKRADAGGRYDFRGIDAVLNAVGPALRKHGVVVMPIKVEPEYTIIATKAGVDMNYCRATVTYRIFGPDGDPVPVDGVSLGEAFDTGDKAGTKAQSVALRTFYINALAIPTNRPELDPEYGVQHEIAGPKPPTAEEYFAELTGARITLPRCRQIREELTRLPALASQEFEDVDGTRMTLIKWVTRIGTSLAAGTEGRG